MSYGLRLKAKQRMHYRSWTGSILTCLLQMFLRPLPAVTLQAA
jgi:hypothetical protein